MDGFFGAYVDRLYIGFSPCFIIPYLTLFLSFVLIVIRAKCLNVHNTSTNQTHNMNVSWADTISCSLPLAHGILLLTVNAVVGVLGSLGNLLVCLAIATNSRLR